MMLLVVSFMAGKPTYGRPQLLQGVVGRKVGHAKELGGDGRDDALEAPKGQAAQGAGEAHEAHAGEGVQGAGAHREG